MEKLDQRMVHRPLELRLPVQAGLRTVGAAFLRESAKAEVETPAGRRGAAAVDPAMPKPERLPAELDLRLDGKKVQRFRTDE